MSPEAPRVLEILEAAHKQCDREWDYTPGRPLGWVEAVMGAIIEKLKDEVRK